MKWILSMLFIGLFFNLNSIYGQNNNDHKLREFFKEFNIALKNNDKETLIKMIDFSKFGWKDWNSTDSELKTKEEFLANYNKIFSKNIRKRIAKAELKTYGLDNYSISWITNSYIYTLHFIFNEKGEYKFIGLYSIPDCPG